MTSRSSRCLAAVAAAGLSLAASVSLALLMRRQLRWRRRRRSGWQLAGSKSELKPGPAGYEALSFDAESGESACALLEVKSHLRWVAFIRSCPHAGIDLLGGDVEDLGNGPVIACPAHTFLFDATTGACLWDPSRGVPTTPALKTFEVSEESGEVWVRPKLEPPTGNAEEWDQAVADALQMEMVGRALERKFPDSD